ncbi:MAG TPA: serine/threonine-protein kinase, partial [Polyangiales bacterium]|nr:serine/threonine-protein kinase [Polyangiales bacterium]
MTSPSKRLGPYELVRRLGAGGMAETFLAVRSGPAGFRQQVCLKRVLPALVQDQGFVQLFLDEARIQSQLRHGNIVQVYDFGEADGAYYLALELVDGVDLNALLRYLGQRGQALPPSVVLHVLRELCRALEVTHALAIDGVAQNLVHRDISPSNILVSVAGEVKLTDFGIALAQSRESKTETGKMRGKLGYMPPEQIHGEVLDARSDLFSVGVVLYQMLTGEHPFRKAGMSDYDVLTRVVRGEHAPVRELAPSVSADLAALCEAMIASDRELRPRNAREILEHTVSLVPPAHADRELAERVAAVQAAQHIAQPGADAQRESQRLTVPGPGPNDPTRAHGERVKTERVHTERSRLESPSWVHDPTRAVDTPLSVPLTAAVSVGPSRRALGVLVASLLLAA